MRGRGNACNCPHPNHNGLPTKYRIKAFSGTNTLCSLCNRADETIDHLHTGCKVSSAAVGAILQHSFDRSAMIPILDAKPDDFRFEGDLRESADMLTLLLFSVAVWRISSFYRVRGTTPSSLRGAVLKIARSFLALRKKVG